MAQATVIEGLRCANRDCNAVLDPERVAHGAKTCDSRCRAAAHRARWGYLPVSDGGPRPVAREGRSHGYSGDICLGCGADVSQSGKVHADDCPVFNEQLRRAREFRPTPRTRSKPSGPQVSYRKAVDAVAAELGQLRRFGLTQLGDETERESAERVLRAVLSVKQRERVAAVASRRKQETR